MEWVLVAGVVAAVAVWVATRVPRRREEPTTPASTSATPARPAVEGPFLGPVATIRLDVHAPDRDAPAVRRLVDGAVARVLRTSPDVTEVVVEDRVGTVVARVPRTRPTPGPPPTRPEREAPAPKSHGSWSEPVVAGVDQDAAVGRRPLAERLDLPESVTGAISHPDDAVEVVRALLVAAGRDAVVRGPTVRSGDDIVIVVDETSDASAALSKAFLRFRESGARRGVVVHLGYVDPREVARRRSLAPDLHHAGPQVLQAMADAVALGGDPIGFALADVAG